MQSPLINKGQQGQSVSDTEVILKVMERLLRTQEEFRKAKMRA